MSGFLGSGGSGNISFDIDDYATLALLDDYAPIALLDDYAQKSLLDSYALISNTLTATTASQTYYCDADFGDDNNDGLTSDTPKKTIDAINTLIPNVIRHNTGVVLKGTFVIPGGVEHSFKDKIITTGKYFIISGPLALNDSDPDWARAWTVIDDNGGANYTADIHSTSSIGFSGAGWTDGEHRGYILQILSGPCAGQMRTLNQMGTSTTLYPIRFFTADPGAGATFRIVRPGTVITNSGSVASFSITGISGGGRVAFQNLFFTGNIGFGIAFNNNSFISLSGLVFSETIPNNRVTFRSNTAQVTCFTSLYSPIIYSLASSTTGLYYGIGSRNTNSNFAFSANTLLYLGESYLDQFGVSSSSFFIMQDCSGRNIYINGVGRYTTTQGMITTTANHNASVFSGGTYGIKIVDSNGTIAPNAAAAISFSNNTTHGLIIERSYIDLSATISGTGNSGAGAYISKNSVFVAKAGAPPTLTGVVGDIAIDDSATAAGTWADVESGTVLSSLLEMTVVKKV